VTRREPKFRDQKGVDKKGVDRRDVHQIFCEMRPLQTNRSCYVNLPSVTSFFVTSFLEKSVGIGIMCP
jgi:hypothetical protein